MSLLWNWGSRNFLRRSMPYSSSMQAQFPKITSRSLSQSLSLPIVPSSSPLVTSLPTYYLWTPMRGVKTHSGCKKRFRVRGSGSIKRGKAGKSHNTGYLKRQRANRLGHSTGIEGKKIEQRVRKLLGVQ